ncbi:F-box domain-containing protein [Mycena kentingensis (nom. inval.)]|nr:F-box domain-containing protein [Mycena kentingensis (nom. inval.)]
MVLLRQLLQDNASEIEAIDTEMDSLRNRISALESRRQSVFQQSKELKAPLSAIRRFPAELLCAIFLEVATAPAETLFITGRWSHAQAPWALGHICRRWRAAALAYRALWSAIYVTELTRLDTIQEQLARAGPTTRLRLFFDNIDSVRDTELENALRTVLATSSRWVAVHFGCVVDYSWTAGLKDAMPLLERVAMFWYHDDLPDSLPVDLFASCPRLRRAQLVAPDLDAFSASYEMQWSQLTHLRVALSPDEHVAILKTATNLIECVLGTSGRSRSDVYPAQNISLPRLRVLRTEDANLLKLLTAPQLEELAMWSEMDDGLDVLDVGDILLFLTRSNCALRNLALFHYSANSHAIITLLRGLKTVDTLLITPGPPIDGNPQTDADWVPALIAELAVQPSNSEAELLVPRLATFYLGYDETVVDVADVVLPLAIRAGSTPFNKLCLFSGNGARMATFVEHDALAKLVAVGVDARWIPADHLSIVEQQWGNFC